MQEHVQLEVSLEVIMAEIAKEMHNLTKLKEENKYNLENEKKLDKLISLQEAAYKGDRKAIIKILNREFN